MTRMGSYRSRGFIQICSLQAERGRSGGRYAPIDGPDTLYLASSERAANVEWRAGFLALFPGADLPPKTVFSAQVYLSRVLDLSTDETQKNVGHQLCGARPAVEGSERSSHTRTRVSLF